MKKTIQININQLLYLMPFTFLNLKQDSLHAIQNLFWIVDLKVFTMANLYTLRVCLKSVYFAENTINKSKS